MLKSLLDESAKAYDASIAEVTRLENLVMDKANGGMLGLRHTK